MSEKDTALHRPSGFSRRGLVKGGGALVGGMLLSTMSNLNQHAMAAAGDLVTGPFGAPVDALDQATGLPLLKLPRGFQYTSFSWTGDMMSDGQTTPSSHDGMAVVAAEGNALTLIRNHEKNGGPLITGGGVYDTVSAQAGRSAGGTTRLRFDGRAWKAAEGALGGTNNNCCGGGTPWGSWLSCEETTTDFRSQGGKAHGFVFEVPASKPSNGLPIEDMGRMAHEAVAIDPLTNIAYLTEDASGRSGLYRFLPRDASGTLDAYLAGGRLQMLKVKAQANADLRNPSHGQSFAVEWVDIAEPAGDPDSVGSAPYSQGYAKGGAKFARLEGIQYHENAMFFTDTSAGPAEEGVVWMYQINPNDRSGDGILVPVFVSQTQITGHMPDNLAVSPQGLILFCEDGGGPAQRLMGITPEGESFVFASNNVVLDNADLTAMGRTGQIGAGDYKSSEWAGACFSPRGDVLFVNIQTPGITFAIWGPFGRARNVGF